MTVTAHLPDAMPDITSKTLLVVCDSHHCVLADVGGHTIMQKEVIKSSEDHATDRPGSKMSPSGTNVSLGEHSEVEENRLRTFASAISKAIDTAVASQGIEEIFISAPGKFLSILKKHLSTSAEKMLVSTADGNYVKEPLVEVLMRFRPDLKEGLSALRDMENYSSKKHLPK